MFSTVSLFNASLILLLALACARAPLSHKEQAMRPLKELPEEFIKLKQSPTPQCSQGAQSEALASALKGILPWLDARPQELMQMGERKLKRSDYARAIRSMLDLAAKGQRLEDLLAQHFEWQEVYGRDEYGDILLTSYYAPSLKASRKPNKELTQPLYGIPEDLVELDLNEWRKHSGHDSKVKSLRLVPAIASPEGDMRPARLVPYYSRAEIDRMNKLASSNVAILAYVDPVDAFFLHIQGSGKLHFTDGTIQHVGYAAQNGHPYYSIGKSLWDVIPQEQMSMARIEQHLRSLAPEVRARLLDLNPSYIFFRPLNNKNAITTSGAEAVAGHTVAVDMSLFPLGMIGWLYFPLPTLPPDQIDPVFPEAPNCGRFIVAQDTGGAIRGADRLDLYWGEGHDAMSIAGAFRHRARLYWLAPK